MFLWTMVLPFTEIEKPTQKQPADITRVIVHAIAAPSLPQRVHVQ